MNGIAQVHVASAGFKFGTAVFEGLPGYWNQSNLRNVSISHGRTHAPARILSAFYALRTSDGESITQQTVELIKANNFRGENLHIMTTVFVSGMGGPGVCGPIGLSITAQERPRSERVIGGVTAQVSSWMRVRIKRCQCGKVQCKLQQWTLSNGSGRGRWL